MSHPYEDRPDRSFWRTGVLNAQRTDWPDLYKPKFSIGSQTKVATAGSCFAQHIGKALRAAGVDVLDGEPTPKGLSEDLAKRFGYGLYSGRYGNIYTPRQMKELLEDIVDVEQSEAIVWERDGRFFDALRPNVEPEGCDSPAEVSALRRDHLLRVGAMLCQADVFVFTLGLTEAWIDVETGRTLPIAPGVLAGDISINQAQFHNFSYPDILQDLNSIWDILKSINPEIKLLLTVSPVPLTATATSDHVLTATQYSKASLRAACGDFCDANEQVDYFASYELVTSSALSEQSFEPNLRSVKPEVVAQVMACFLAAHNIETPDKLGGVESLDSAPAANESYDLQTQQDELVCEELLLDAFSK
jgi:hypothetical protein